MGPTLKAQQKFVFLPLFFVLCLHISGGTAAGRGPGFVQQSWANSSRFTNRREISSTRKAEHAPHKKRDEQVQEIFLAPLSPDYACSFGAISD